MLSCQTFHYQIVLIIVSSSLSYLKFMFVILMMHFLEDERISELLQIWKLNVTLQFINSTPLKFKSSVKYFCIKKLILLDFYPEHFSINPVFVTELSSIL